MSKLKSPETIIKKINDKLTSRDKYTFAISFILSLCVYFPMLTSWLGNPDSFWNGLLYKNGALWELRLGRFGLTFLYWLTKYYISPELSCIFSFLLLGFICVVIRRIFSIDEYWMIVAMAMVIICNPMIATTLTYYYCSAHYFIAYFLAVLSVYILRKNRDPIKSPVLVIILTVLSMSIYQAYVSVIATLVLFLIVLDILRMRSFSDIISFSVRSAAAYLISCILYLISVRVVCFIFSTKPADRASLALKLSEIITRLKAAYIYCFSFFFRNGFIFNGWGGRKELNIIITLIILIALAVYVKKSGLKPCRLFASITISALLPVAFFLCTILFQTTYGNGDTNFMTIVPVYYYYLLPVIIVSMLRDGTQSSVMLHWISLGFYALLSIVFISTCIAFQGYMRMQLNSMEYLAYGSREKIDSLIIENDLPEDTPVLFAGDVPENDLYNSLIDPVYGTIAEYGLLWDNYNSRQQTWMCVLRHLTGKGYETTSETECTEIMGTDAFEEMAIFPGDNCVRLINDIIVIRIGE